MFLLDVIAEPRPNPSNPPADMGNTLSQLLSNPEIAWAVAGVAVALVIALTIIIIKRR